MSGGLKKFRLSQVTRCSKQSPLLLRHHQVHRRLVLIRNGHTEAWSRPSQKALEHTKTLRHTITTLHSTKRILLRLRQRHKLPTTLSGTRTSLHRTRPQRQHLRILRTTLLLPTPPSNLLHSSSNHNRHMPLCQTHNRQLVIVD